MILEHRNECQALMTEIVAEVEACDDGGVVASYIPELADVEPSKMGVTPATHGKICKPSFHPEMSLGCTPNTTYLVGHKRSRSDDQA
jgi:hypothetical protein